MSVIDTIEFFRALYPEDAQGHTYLWTLPDKRTQVFAAAAYAEMAQAARKTGDTGKDVYFSVGLSERLFRPHERAKSTDIVAIPALWVDIDIAGDAHAAKSLPPDYAAARALLPEMFDPSIVVDSGHGIHAYYGFRELLDTRTDAEQSTAQDLLRRLQGAVRARAEAKSWHVDSTPDLCRVLRVPGTLNHKGGGAVPCVVAEYSEGLRYNAEDFDVLPPVEAICKTERTATFKRRPTDGDARLMIENCTFLQHFTQHYQSLPEPVWKAACTNLMRGVGGEEIILPLVKEWLDTKFNADDTRKKLAHYLNECTPQTCTHIQTDLGFKGCVDCPGIKSPCAWSLGKVPQAIAKLRQIALPNAENTLNEETIGALALVKKENGLEYARFKERCKGNVNLNDLQREVKRAQASQAGLSVVEGGALVAGQRLGDITTRTFVPDTPLDLAIPANFAYGADGIYEVRMTEMGQVQRLAAGTPVIISEKQYNIDTQMEKVELSFRYYNHWVRTVCKRSEVFSARGIIALADRGLNTSSESAKYLVKYLQALEAANPHIPLVHAVSKIGWRPYALNEFVIPSSSRYRVDLDDDGELAAAFTECGTLAEWKAAAQEIRKYTFARFVLAASFATPLLRICKNRNFMIYFWGTSGGGKTAAQRFALSVWGNPTRLMKSFYGTTNGLERAAEYSNDFPLVINERQVMMGNNKQEALESLVYMLEGGHGKVRASKSGIRKTATWRTIAMASGEEPLSKESSIQGVKTRLIELNTYPVLPEQAAKMVYTIDEEQHGTAGRAFIARLLQDAGTEYAEILAARQALINRLRVECPDHFEPHIDNVATVAIADMLASMWLFGESPEAAQQGAYDMAIAIMGEQATKQEISDTRRAWDFVDEWIVSNWQHFSNDNGYDSRAKLSPEYGFIRSGYVNVYPMYLRAALDDAGFSSNKFLKEFAEMGLICSSPEKNKRRFTKRVSYGGTKLHVVQIPQVMEGLL